MSQDFEDKEPNAPVEETSSADPVTSEAQDESRRRFLTNLGKWSGAVIGIALLGNAVSSTDAEAEADSDKKPEESWRCWRCWRCRCRCRCRCW